MAPTPKAGHGVRYASLVIVLIVAAGVALLLADPSIPRGPATSGMNTTSTTGTTPSQSSGAAQVSIVTARCTGSGTTERCMLNLTNTGNSATAITGAGTLSYNGAGGMGVNTVRTTDGCVVTAGSLGPGQSEKVTCSYSVNQIATSGSQLSGTVALGDGDNASFIGTVS